MKHSRHEQYDDDILMTVMRGCGCVCVWCVRVLTAMEQKMGELQAKRRLRTLHAIGDVIISTFGCALRALLVPMVSCLARQRAMGTVCIS